MFSEDVLEFITRDTPLSADLVELAWSDISTETKLEIIETFRAQKPYMPQWLVELGLRDEAAIVRYFASRQNNYNDQEYRGLIENDPCSLVRGNNIRVGWLDNFDQIDKLDFKNKLSAIRNLQSAKFEYFVDWLEKNHSKMDRQELVYVVLEYFKHPKVKELLENQSSRLDGMAEFSLGKAMKKLWSIVNDVSYPSLPYLTLYAPTKLGMDEMKIDDFKHLSTDVLKNVVRRRSSKEIDALVRHIIDNPSQYDAEITKEIRSDMADDAEDLSFLEKKYQDYIFPSFIRSEKNAKQMVEIQRKIYQIEDAIKAQKNKKGLFF